MTERKATIYDYARLKKTLCDTGNNCYGCPLGIYNNGEKVICNQLITKYTDKANKIILEWCDENSQRTYKDDFLEKFPNIKMYSGFPIVCRNYIYSIEKKCRDGNCVNCWNETMEV